MTFHTKHLWLKNHYFIVKHKKFIYFTLNQLHPRVWGIFIFYGWITSHPEI